MSSSAPTAPDILVHKHLGMRSLTLNRPHALNALNVSMIRGLTAHLQAFQQSEICKVILLKGQGRAFCAGGDVKAVIQAAKQKDPNTSGFFAEEYQLNHLLATMSKPVVAILDGITMGGGVGISVHAPFRIATENTMFAMPETSIGLFPDVGGSFFLPRLDGNLGMYLGLTGDRLAGQAVYWAGIATHYVPTSQLASLERRLADLDSSNLHVIQQAIEEFAGEVSLDSFPLAKDDQQSVISECFGKETVEEILSALEAHGSPFAKKTLETLHRMSPTSLKVTFRQLKEGGKKDIVDCFRMEFRMASHFLEAITTGAKPSDFEVGVQHVLVDKKKGVAPWNPEKVEHVTAADVDWYFRPLDKSEEWKPFVPVSFEHYPTNMGLPFEREVDAALAHLTTDKKTPAVKDVLAYFEQSSSAHHQGAPKLGVADKVKHYLRKKHLVDGTGARSSRM